MDRKVGIRWKRKRRSITSIIIFIFLYFRRSFLFEVDSIMSESREAEGE
jgi:hypothetical protein